MDSYKDDRFEITLKEGIVHIIFKKEYVDYDFVNDGILRRNEITKGHTYPLFSDFRIVKSGTREARERFAAPDGGIGVSAVAVLINSKIHKIMYNFFNSIYKAPAPAKLFTDPQKVLKWLEQYK